LHSDSRAFDKPKSGRIAVKVINHLGDEVDSMREWRSAITSIPRRNSRTSIDTT
jgi:hypothetical protein